MGFKTNRKTGNVFNDNKKRSDEHHGSVKPDSGIRMDKKVEMHCFNCGSNTHTTEGHDAYAKAWDEKYFPRTLNKTWVDFYGTEEDKKEYERQQKELADLREKWSKTFGYRPNKFSDLSSGEIENDINYYKRQMITFSNQNYDDAKKRKEMAEISSKIQELEKELKIRKEENKILDKKIDSLEKASEKELIAIRHLTRDQIAYDAVVWVLRKRGLWKGSTEKTEEFLKNR